MAVHVHSVPSTPTQPRRTRGACAGDNIAMSWFLIVKQVSPTETYKLIIWGTGAEVPSLLFELVSDPMEDNNLIATPAGAAAHKDLVDSLTAQVGVYMCVCVCVCVCVLPWSCTVTAFA